MLGMCGRSWEQHNIGLLDSTVSSVRPTGLPPVVSHSVGDGWVINCRWKESLGLEGERKERGVGWKRNIRGCSIDECYDEIEFIYNSRLLLALIIK